jgi:hypothetical protein
MSVTIKKIGLTNLDKETRQYQFVMFKNLEKFMLNLKAEQQSHTSMTVVLLMDSPV